MCGERGWPCSNLALSCCISSCTSKSGNKLWSLSLLSGWVPQAFKHITVFIPCWSEPLQKSACRVFFLTQGIILSGGQKQRISVARALYQQTNLVFLVGLYTHPHTHTHTSTQPSPHTPALKPSFPVDWTFNQPHFQHSQWHSVSIFDAFLRD